jgi:hypothetical protein
VHRASAPFPAHRRRRSLADGARAGLFVPAPLSVHPRPATPIRQRPRGPEARCQFSVARRRQSDNVRARLDAGGRGRFTVATRRESDNARLARVVCARRCQFAVAWRRESDNARQVPGPVVTSASPCDANRTTRQLARIVRALHPLCITTATTLPLRRPPRVPAVVGRRTYYFHDRTTAAGPGWPGLRRRLEPRAFRIGRRPRVARGPSSFDELLTRPAAPCRTPEDWDRGAAARRAGTTEGRPPAARRYGASSGRAARSRFPSRLR